MINYEYEFIISEINAVMPDPDGPQPDDADEKRLLQEWELTKERRLCIIIFGLDDDSNQCVKVLCTNLNLSTQEYAAGMV